MSLKKELKKDQDDKSRFIKQQEMLNSPCETIVESYLVTNGKELSLISYHRSWKREYETRVDKCIKDDDNQD